MAVKRYDGSQWVTVAGKGDQGTSSSISIWVKTASGGETSVSGNDDNSQPLSYTVGQELVFINGVLQKRGADYTATTGNSITGLAALTSGDIVSVWTVNAFSVSNAISNTIVDAKGDILVGTGADTPGRLPVGTNGQVLTAASTTGTGLAWVTPLSGSMTLLSTTSLSGTTTTVSSIDQTYENLYIEVVNLDLLNTVGNVYFRPNSLTTGWYGTALQLNGDNGTTNSIGQNNTEIAGGLRMMRANDGGQNIWAITIFNYASTTERKPAFMDFVYRGTIDSSNNVTQTAGQSAGGYQTTSAISSFAVVSAGGSFSAGSIKIYGVK